MNIFNSTIDASEYIQSQADLLIHEISKPPIPFDYDKINHKIPLKYKNSEVRIINDIISLLIINNVYRKSHN